MPSLFQYATKELSQDAFFCWFLSWSADSYKTVDSILHERSRAFLSSILPNDIFTEDYSIDFLEIKKQYKNIDFFVVINKSIVILFEDKVNSKNHDDQLKRYYDIIKKEYTDCTIQKVYLKTDIVWKEEKKAIEENGYKLLDIYQISDLLKPGTENSIYEDFVSHINLKLNRYNSYKNRKVRDWSKIEWDGFLYDLSSELEGVWYGKHFVGEQFWFVLSWRDVSVYDKCAISLEYFDKKLVIKAHKFEDKSNRREYRDIITPKMKKAFEGYKFKVINREGRSATILKFDDMFVLDASGLLMFDDTVSMLKGMISVFKQIVVE